MRRWTVYYFRARQTEFNEVLRKQGMAIANEHVTSCIERGKRDLGTYHLLFPSMYAYSYPSLNEEMWQQIAATSEKFRRDLINRMIREVDQTST